MGQPVWIVLQEDQESWKGLDDDQIRDLKEQIRGEFGSHVPVIVLPPGCQLEILGEADDFLPGGDQGGGGEPAPVSQE